MRSSSPQPAACFQTVMGGHVNVHDAQALVDVSCVSAVGSLVDTAKGELMQGTVELSLSYVRIYTYNNTLG